MVIEKKEFLVSIAKKEKEEKEGGKREKGGRRGGREGRRKEREVIGPYAGGCKTVHFWNINFLL